MKFICFCYYEPKKFDAMTQDDIEAMMRACKPHDEQLHADPGLEFVASLAFPSEAAIIRPGEGAPTISRGAYTDGREQIGAFFIVEADDLEAATAIAAKHPGGYVGQYVGGGIEVRPCEQVGILKRKQESATRSG
ncbi:YciI family protein [Luteimonas panaciterrae]|uniref:YciI family protein n=1 Tax=Luteimonas panaciterrae TaxID=363885 RepID=UPI001CFAF1DE|nr:YciI family protein [Luteimonas panaciterrae]